MLDILLPLFYFILLSFFIYKSPFFHLKGFAKSTLNWVFLLKTICGIALWWIYTYYYSDRVSADIYKYFDDAVTIRTLSAGKATLLFQIFSGIVWQQNEVYEILQHTEHWYKDFNSYLFNDNRMMTRLHILFLFLSNGIFHVHNLFFAFFSLVGLTALFKFFTHFVNPTRLVFLSVFLIPSVLFWTSGALKEAWLSCIIGLFLWRLSLFLKDRNLKNSFWLLIFFIAFLNIKPYVLLVLFPAVLFLLLSNFIKTKPIKLFISLHLVLIIGIATLSFVVPSISIFELLEKKQNAFYYVIETTNPNSTIEIPPINDFTSAMVAAPRAIYNSLFRPWIFESNNILQLMSGIENLLFVILMIAALAFFKRSDIDQHRLILFSISFIICLSLLIGWTTPVIGAIVRYKVPFLPFLAILLFQFMDLNKIRSLFQKNE